MKTSGKKTSLRPIAKPIVLSIQLILASGVLFAQQHTLANSTQQDIQYNVQAGSLTQALNQFALQAEVKLSLDSKKLAHLNSTGLQGKYSVDSGFQELLRHTDYQIRKIDNGYTVVEKSKPQVRDMGRLNTIDVNARSQSPTLSDPDAVQLPLITVTAEQESYTVKSANTATKLNLSLKETPQSVTVITRQKMEDLGLDSISDIVRNTPGLTSTATAPYRETFFSRGFDIQNYNFDGLSVSTNSSRRGMLPHDMAIYEKVEIVRGSAGLTQGSGTPSAAINFIRKRPTHDFQLSTQAQVGRWDHYRAEADVSGSLTSSENVRGRAVLMWQDSDSFQDVVTENKKLAYTIGEIDITDNTLLTVSAAYQENENNTTYGGLPTAKDGADLHLPRSTYYGTNWNYWNDDTTSVFASLEHRFNNQWKVTLAANLIWGNQEQLRGGVGLNESNDQWDHSGGWAKVVSDRQSYDLSAQGPFKLFNREHELVFGASLRDSDESNDTAGYWPASYYFRNIDIYNWDHNVLKPDTFKIDYYAKSNEKQHGFYGTTRLNLADSLKLILGLRIDTLEFTQSSEVLNHDTNIWRPSQSGYDMDNHLTKYAGLIYDLNKNHSIYASYTDIFKAQSQKDIHDNFLDPIVGENYEIGLKGEYFDGALNTSVAVFRVDEDNKAMSVGLCPFNVNQTCYRAAGMVRSEGYDLEIQGALTENLQVGGGFTHVKKEIKRDANPNNIGLKQNTQMPENQFKLSGSYRLPDGKWRIGGNVRWQDDVYYENTGFNYRTEQNGYFIFDAMLGYKHNPHLDIQLNVNNVLDKVYYSSINAQPVVWGGNSVYGEPRNFILTARYKF